MSKSKRGKNIKSTKNWRGTCPKCNRTGTRLLWDLTDGENKLKVCKICDAHARNKAS